MILFNQFLNLGVVRDAGVVIALLLSSVAYLLPSALADEGGGQCF
jgi:hypothetical protein